MQHPIGRTTRRFLANLVSASWDVATVNIIICGVLVRSRNIGEERRQHWQLLSESFLHFLVRFQLLAKL